MIAILRANWHTDIVDIGIKSFTSKITELGYGADTIHIVDVPGSLEFPLQAKLLAETGKYEAIVCIGLIVDGGIYRHDFVAQTVVDGIVQVSLETRVPVMSVALTPKEFRENSEPHEKFFKDHFFTKGEEAADATHMMIQNVKNFS